jgi:oxygen-independent coproporphyrinogen III oxidase
VDEETSEADQRAGSAQLCDPARLQQLIHDRLGAAGYQNVGMDHYAKPDDEMVKAQKNKTLWRNFQGYTTHKNCDIYAFGASSISQTRDVYMQNEKNLKQYQERVAAGHLPVERGLRLTHEDQIRRDLITRIMCDMELDTEALASNGVSIFPTNSPMAWPNCRPWLPTAWFGWTRDGLW